jgi:hypothetical protein
MRKLVALALGFGFWGVQAQSGTEMGPNGQKLESIIGTHCQRGLMPAEGQTLDSVFRVQNHERSLRWLDAMPARYQGYKPKSGTLRKLRKLDFSAVNLVFVGGNWCPDTQGGLPDIMRVLDAIGVDTNSWTYLSVDRQKRLLSIDGLAPDSIFWVERVPTVIALVNGSEVGRIIEFPERSWEEDLYRWLKQ